MRRWDIFCRVIDNLGDIGVCWRLAQQLGNEYQLIVRLWVDDLQSFACLCPSISPTVNQQWLGPIEIRRWPVDFPLISAADVVIEAFGCDLPQDYLARMSQCAPPPVWINLEYLSAESWVEDCHLVESPQSRSGLKKYFFFPGFTERTGGLLQEGTVLADQAAFDSAAIANFWSSLGIAPETDDELRVSLFCYRNAALPGLLQSWSDGPRPVRVVTFPGDALNQVAEWLGCPFPAGGICECGALSIHSFPFLAPPIYDRLLWACDLNFVRGEDSFVRAQWAQRPFVWQIYPQTEDAHLVKLEAFLSRYLCDFVEKDAVLAFWRAWNTHGDIRATWRDFESNLPRLERHGKVWLGQLDRAGNLANNLVRFVGGQ